ESKTQPERSLRVRNRPVHGVSRVQLGATSGPAPSPDLLGQPDEGGKIPRTRVGPQYRLAGRPHRASAEETAGRPGMSTNVLTLAYEALVQATRETEPTQRQRWLDIAQQWLARAEETIGHDERRAGARLRRSRRLH